MVIIKIEFVSFMLQAIQFKYDYGEFDRKAREWTRIFAPKRDLNELKPVCLHRIS